MCIYIYRYIFIFIDLYLYLYIDPPHVPTSILVFFPAGLIDLKTLHLGEIHIHIYIYMSIYVCIYIYMYVYLSGFRFVV